MLDRRCRARRRRARCTSIRPIRDALSTFKCAWRAAERLLVCSAHTTSGHPGAASCSIASRCCTYDHMRAASRRARGGAAAVWLSWWWLYPEDCSARARARAALLKPREACHVGVRAVRCDATQRAASCRGGGTPVAVAHHSQGPYVRLCSASGARYRVRSGIVRHHAARLRRARRVAAPIVQSTWCAPLRLRRGAPFSRPPRMPSTPASMTSHSAATRLALGAAVRRLQLVLFHRCTCSAERRAPAQQETHAARAGRTMPRGSAARRSRGGAARRTHSHKAECCTERRPCARRRQQKTAASSTTRAS